MHLREATYGYYENAAHLVIVSGSTVGPWRRSKVMLIMREYSGMKSVALNKFVVGGTPAAGGESVAALLMLLGIEVKIVHAPIIIIEITSSLLPVRSVKSSHINLFITMKWIKRHLPLVPHALRRNQCQWRQIIARANSPGRDKFTAHR